MGRSQADVVSVGCADAVASRPFRSDGSAILLEVSASSGDMNERATRVFVIEDPPPATPPRWYCAGTRGFDTPEDAVGWALSHGHSAIVRTLGGTSYWAGQRPWTGTRRVTGAHYDRGHPRLESDGDSPNEDQGGRDDSAAIGL